MSYEFNCPYLSKVKNGVIICEFAKITPPDNTSRKEFLTEHCGHATQYKECACYKVLDNYYRRKYNTEGDTPW